MSRLFKDPEIKQWLTDLKKRIRQSQIKAMTKVNDEMLHLYWDLGRDIVLRQMDSVWGSGFFRNLSNELKDEFPEMMGFSERNLYRMKQLYMFYNQDVKILPQLGTELGTTNFLQIGEKIETVNLPQLGTELQLPENMDKIIYPQLEDGLNVHLIFQIPWRHHIEIISKCQSVHEAMFYVQKTIQNRRYIDLLFYHLELRCFIVCEVKIQDFQPEHTGKLGFYIAAVNHQLKKEIDNPTIGILIVKKKDNVDAQYSLESSNQPIGISEYTLSKLIPENFKSSLPSIEEIEYELNKNVTGTEEFT